MKTLGEFQGELTRFVSPWEERQLQIYEHPASDEVLVRREKTFSISEGMGLYHEHDTMLDELWRDFGVENAGRVHILSDTGSLLAVTEKIYGTRLDIAIEQDLPGAVDAAEQLYTALTQYLTHKIGSGEPILSDIESSYQYMYDQKRGVAILVDVDSHVSKGAALTDFMLQLSVLYDSIFEDSRRSNLPKSILENIKKLILSVDPNLKDEPKFKHALMALRQIVQENRSLDEHEFELMFWG